MKRLFKLLYITGFLCLGVLLLSTGCRMSVSTTTQPATNDTRITVLPTVDDPEGDIRFENVTLTKGILEKEYFTSWAGDHKAGAPCFLVNGRIVNSSGTRYWVAHHADGFDDGGNQVSGTLDAGPIIGIAQIAIEPRSVENFTLHLGWSDNATSFTLHSQKSAMMFP
jgi:hypothetical protein